MNFGMGKFAYYTDNVFKSVNDGHEKIVPLGEQMWPRHDAITLFKVSSKVGGSEKAELARVCQLMERSREDREWH